LRQQRRFPITDGYRRTITKRDRSFEIAVGVGTDVAIESVSPDRGQNVTTALQYRTYEHDRNKRTMIFESNLRKLI
jgi:hypothetical protein